MSFEKSFGDAVAKSFEPGASSVKERLKSLEQIRLSGTKTFAFIGPLLPGNLVDVLEGKVDRVFIDRMNYLHSVKGFYREQDKRIAEILGGEESLKVDDKTLAKYLV